MSCYFRTRAIIYWRGIDLPWPLLHKHAAKFEGRSVSACSGR